MMADDMRRIAEALDTAYGCLELVEVKVSIVDIEECKDQIKTAREIARALQGFDPLGGASRGVGRCTCPCGKGTDPGCQVHP